MYQVTRSYSLSRTRQQPIPQGLPAFETIPLRPGLEMTICNKSHPRGLKIDFDIEKSPVSLSYNLSLPMRTTMVHENGRKTMVERRAGDGFMAYLPNTRGTNEAPSGLLTSLSIYIARPVFCELFTQLPDGLKKLEASRSKDPVARPVYHKSAMDWNVRFIIRQIVQCPYQGDTRRVFLEAKALELIAHKLDEMGRMDLGGASQLSRGDLDRAREAYHILLNRIECPPSLQDLSVMVGMNRNKLNNGFKKLYGGTVFKVLRDARLSKAVSLLQDTDSSLSEIALSVGYSDQANFSNAFRRHFGHTPKLVRMERARI
ncbi:MAG: helix-turn-helix transcriptional regulator [Desulfobacteraceae bacterium]|nr:helix-turn-helix transcriptional regulator [Desulfobacteraceae bacterium]